jgi:cysteine desulfurase
LKDILKNIPEAKLNGCWNENEWKLDKQGIVREDRIAKRLPSNISVWLPDFPSDEMVLRLDKKGFSVSAGSACSAKSDEYSHVIFSLYKNKIKKFEAEKVARETIRISINEDIKDEDLKRFSKTLKEIYYKFKK